ncbi:nucleoside deaminase [Actinospica robiniae]|uniref:nucleoside deaminase n=1 Tax=Actinospica robiniae TaxID=304901 RepID=UPI002480BC7A|nr:nucleoside deaminase [Actinospica robiniae]
MTSQDSAHGTWDALDRPWRVAIEAAWQSYREGGIAVGAVLTAGDGAVISAGRNQRFSGQAQGLLAHAEMEALGAMPPAKQRAIDNILYTTLSPCPMCLGAIVVARVGQVHIGAVDPTWHGIEKLPSLNVEVQRRWPRMHGPLPGPLGTWLAIAPCLNTSGSLLRALEATAPTDAALARAVDLRYRESTLLPGTALEALEHVWDLVSDRGGRGERMSR